MDVWKEPHIKVKIKGLYITRTGNKWKYEWFDQRLCEREELGPGGLWMNFISLFEDQMKKKIQEQTDVAIITHMLSFIPGTDHHHVHLRQSEWLRGSRVPLRPKGPHHPFSAPEKCGHTKSHNQPLQYHSFYVCLCPQLQLLKRYKCRVYRIWFFTCKRNY